MVLKFLRLLVLLILVPILTNGQSNSLMKIEQIEFYGNFKTEESHLLRAMKPYSLGMEFPLKDTFLMKQEIQTLLNNTELFNKIEVNGKYTNSGYLLEIGIWERYPIIPEGEISFADRNINVWMNEQHFDWRRVNIGIGAVHHNVGGKQQQIGIFTQIGYTPKFSLRYFNPYLDEDKKHGLGLELSILANKEVNVATLDYQQVFYKNHEQFIHQKLEANVFYQYKPDHDFALQWGLKLQNETFDSSLIQLFPHFLDHSIIDRWAIVPHFKLTFNQVDYWNYPLKGWRAVLNTEIQLPLSKQDTHWPIDLQLDYFMKIHPRWYFSIIGRAGTSIIQGSSYAQQRNLGYDQHYLRGFEQYVFDGTGFFLFRENIKYKILDWNFNWNQRYFEKIPLQVYLKIYSDQGQYFTNPSMNSDHYAQQWLYSYGLGVDILTLYGLKFRIEYSFNNLQENGLNFHRSGE